MKIKFTLLSCFVLLLNSSKGQLIQGSIQSGPSSNQVEVLIRPDFNNSTQYLAQILMPIAFPASVPLPYPTLSALNITLDPGFIATFGSNYGVQVYAMANNTGNTEKYYTIALVRAGAGSSNAQTWVSGTQYKVLTATFQGSTGSAQIKLADYQDAGSDGQGNFYAADGNATYYYDAADSRNNFYAIAGPTGSTTSGSTSAAGFARTTALVSLPASLLNFSGYKSGAKNVLKWTTTTEQNNLGFEVQRSGDGINYSTVGFVSSNAADGNSSTNLSYNYDDNSPAAGRKNYYRLNQKDIDGRSKLSNIVLISGDKPTSIGIGGIFPNPASTQISVILDAPRRDDVTLVVMDVTGKTVSQKLVSVETGSNTVSLEIGKLAQGSYLVKAVSRSSDGETATSKFVKN